MNSANKKFWEKIASEKTAKYVFYIHPNVVTKKIGKKRSKQFFQKHTNCAMKKCWEKIVGKIAKKRFLYSHDNHHQKMGGGNTRKTIFPETNELCAQKIFGKKIVGKKCETTFLIFTRIS